MFSQIAGFEGCAKLFTEYSVEGGTLSARSRVWAGASRDVRSSRGSDITSVSINFLTLDKLVKYKLQRLTTFDHHHHKHSLVEGMLSLDKIAEELKV